MISTSKKVKDFVLTGRTLTIYYGDGTYNFHYGTNISNSKFFIFDGVNAKIKIPRKCYKIVNKIVKRPIKKPINRPIKKLINRPSGQKLQLIADRQSMKHGHYTRAVLTELSNIINLNCDSGTIYNYEFSEKRKLKNGKIRYQNSMYFMTLDRNLFTVKYKKSQVIKLFVIYEK